MVKNTNFKGRVKAMIKIIANVIEREHCPGGFLCIMSCDPHNQPVRLIFLFSLL